MFSRIFLLRVAIGWELEGGIKDWMDGGIIELMVTIILFAGSYRKGQEVLSGR
jgi:hypothetical protein